MQWEGRRGRAMGDTWEPLANVTNCEEVIRDFERAQGAVVPGPRLPAPGPPALQAT